MYFSMTILTSQHITAPTNEWPSSQHNTCILQVTACECTEEGGEREGYIYRHPVADKRTYILSISGMTRCTKTCSSSCSPKGPVGNAKTRKISHSKSHTLLTHSVNLGKCVQKNKRIQYPVLWHILLEKCTLCECPNTMNKANYILSYSN